MKPALRIGVIVAALFVTAMLIWQGVTAHGAPDPMRPNTSQTVAFLDIGILVFREGLECILVLAAITASMTGARSVHRQPVALGAGLAFVASLITWFIAVRIVGSLSDNMSALDLQAATGLLAVIVLRVVLKGALLGLMLTGMVAVLTFVLQQRLPYRKMLITTGILLGVVLLVMVGEQAQEMQLANWISTTPIPWLAHSIPAWMSLWFAVFPTYETMAAQFLAALLVIGSYYAAKRFGAVPLAGADSVEEAKRVSIDTGMVKPLQAVR